MINQDWVSGDGRSKSINGLAEPGSTNITMVISFPTLLNDGHVKE